MLSQTFRFLYLSSSDDSPPLELSAETVHMTLPVRSEKERLLLFSEQLSLNDSQLLEIEKVTREQSSSNCWWEKRLGRITASKFGEDDMKGKLMRRMRDKRMFHV